ncbi:hypothetical protein ACFQ6C_26660 [Streptomyces sp. NPDC056454]|uniref:hypothetical protein n=1 Tax=Streptomyces sp. NPDC056454 TaxID=3345823 RepID=UPI0036A4CC4A
MTVTDPAQKIRLQGVGWVPAVPAHELAVGDQLMYNGGSVSQITKIVDATPKFFTIHEVCTQRGEEYQRRVKKDRPVARVAEHHRSPLGYHTAPATDYRAQISPPTGDLGWITVGHGDTFDAAVSGLTPSRQESTHFGSVMLDNHGLGWTAKNHEGRADSLKAMREGATLTAADGHSFRVLPPETPTVEPYAVGTRVRHSGQEWAMATAAPGGTAVVVAVGPDRHGGAREYTVLTGEEFSLRPGPGNPMTRYVGWDSSRVRFVAPPLFEELLSSLPGHFLTVTLDGHRVIVSLHEGGNTAPVLTDWVGDHVPNAAQSTAQVLVRRREADLKEVAAVAALDDAVEYVALRTGADAERISAERGREILRQARQEAGPEPLRDHGAPRMTLNHSGAFWNATVHAFTPTGQRNRREDRSVTIAPAVVVDVMGIIGQTCGEVTIHPVAKPSIHSYGAWVRPVDGHHDRVIVARTATGLYRRPGREETGTRWDEYMSAYRAALTGAGWTFEERTDDGDVYQRPAL